MNHNEVFSKIDSLYGRYLDILREVCEIESPTDHKVGVDAVGRYFLDFAASRGWETDIHREALSGDAIAITMNPNAPGAPVSLSGHMDTVHPVGSFGDTPVRRDEECTFGPGTVDCKGGLIAALLAMDALDALGFSERPVKLLLQSDEEIGSRLSEKRTINYICDMAKGSAAFLNLEGNSGEYFTVARKGIANFRFTVIGKEAHSSSCATEGASAIAEAAYKIIELEKFKDEGGITCNCGVISGGSVPNTVAGRCEFIANFRFATAKELSEVKAAVSRIAEETHVHGCSCTVEQFSERVAMEKTERNLALADRINDIFRKVGRPPRKTKSGLGGSDAADVTAAGIPCLDSFGVRGGYVHSEREYMFNISLSDAAKEIAAVILYI